MPAGTSGGSITDATIPAPKTATTKTFCYRDEKVSLVAAFTQEINGVLIREDYLENLSGQPLEIRALSSRFCMDGHAYAVYTQYNGWQHESAGQWQDLVTQVTASSQGIRTCDGAAPLMALHNMHSGQNTVFHLLPNAQWKITARKFPENEKQTVVLETGFNNENMHLTVQAGERIHLPAVIVFTAQNKTDLDAYKLHEVYNRRYPRKSLPVTYNSWLHCFGNLDVDDLLKQVDCAADLGIEAFMIDAGWFGDGNEWALSVGDWCENLTAGPKGRLIEISDRVRERGMLFGLWFEPERADPKSRAVQEHPNYYINGTLFDFANPSAVEYMLGVLSEQIEKYHIGWLKFDFNASIPLDPSGNAFYRYMQGQKRFVERLREAYPHLYITNCASGGYRMELGQGTLFDSFWLSDNQGPYEGIRIVKDTLKRMPTALIERWNVQKYSEGFPRHGYPEPVGVMFSCNNATWDFILNVDDSFTKQFINAGPIGFSCDLVSLPPDSKASWKDMVKLMADSGFRYVAMGFSDEKPLLQDDWKSYIDMMGETLAAHGLTCVQTHAPYYSLLISAEQRDPRMEKALLRSMEATAMLGAEICAVHPRSVIIEGAPRETAVDREKSLQENILAFAPLAQACEKHDVLLGIENLMRYPHANPYFYSWIAEDQCALIDRLNSKNVAAIWDFGHANLIDTDHADRIRTLGSRIKGTHVHNNDGVEDSHFPPFLPAPDGCGVRRTVNWEAVLAALKAIGYDGYLTLETNFNFNYPIGSYMQYLYDSVCALDDILQAQ